MINTTVDNVFFCNLKFANEENGCLIPIEEFKDIPFSVKRVFVVFGVKDDDERGKHAHFNTKQVLVCLNGQIEVICHDGKKERRFNLNKPYQALYIPEMIWDSQIYKSKQSMMLSLCSTEYMPSDYISDFEQFKRIKQC